MSTIVDSVMHKIANQIVPGLHGRLRRERERLGFSQEEFARRLGITRVTQNYYENGTRDPGLTYLTAFGQNGGDLLYLLFAEESGVEYAEILDWELVDKVWAWVQRVAVDAEGCPYSVDLQIKAFKVAYRACRKMKRVDPGGLDLPALVLGDAA